MLLLLLHSTLFHNIIDNVIIPQRQASRHIFIFAQLLLMTISVGAQTEITRCDVCESCTVSAVTVIHPTYLNNHWIADAHVNLRTISPCFFWQCLTLLVQRFLHFTNVWFVNMLLMLTLCSMCSHFSRFINVIFLTRTHFLRTILFC